MYLENVWFSQILIMNEPNYVASFSNIIQVLLSFGVIKRPKVFQKLAKWDRQTNRMISF